MLSYTAANQLYFSVRPRPRRRAPTTTTGTGEPAPSLPLCRSILRGDGDGRRVISKVDRANLVVGGPKPNDPSGSRQYYMYDGNDVAVVLTRMGTTWFVRQRILSGGLDRPLATRISPQGTATQNLAFIADRQGTTLAAVRPDGLRDETVAYFGRNVFGTLEGASGSGSTANAETGFTGASTPNQTGGFTYLRNRWYDPQSGRFLTQDPIGLAGGVNLYAYAGNNPVSFSDPYGLCPGCKKLKKAVIKAISSSLRITEQEAEWAVENPLLAAAAGYIRPRATLFGRNMASLFASPDGETDERIENAGRHLYGSCQLTQNFGTSAAEKITEAHEENSPGSDTKDTATDRANNAAGIEAGSDSDTRCEQFTINAIQDGDYAK